MANDFEIIIVGSGFGGAATACRLAQAGRKVLVLERGREWRREDYPRAPGDAWIWDDNCPEKRNGWIDLRHFGDMKVVQGAAVGGGSLIYANVSVEAQPFVFEKGWTAEISYAALQQHYAARSEEQKSELQSLMRTVYSVFVLKKKKQNKAK